MVVLNGKFNGKQVVLDTIPEGIAPNTPVRVLIMPEGKSFALEAIAAMAVQGGLPPDFAAQHHHYMNGVPKR